VRVGSVPYSLNSSYSSSIDATFLGEFLANPNWDGDGFTKDLGAGDTVDCNDGNSAVYPGAPEACDGIDNQCPGDVGFGLVDEGCVCTDGDTDGYFQESGCGTTVDCDDADQNAWDTCATCVDDNSDGWFELCNAYVGIDGPDECDYDPSNWTIDGCGLCEDLDGDGYYDYCDDYSLLGGSPDCYDCIVCCGWLCADVYPGAPELCDGVDNQCPGDPGDGFIDEGCPDGPSLSFDGANLTMVDGSTYGEFNFSGLNVGIGIGNTTCAVTGDGIECWIKLINLDSDAYMANAFITVGPCTGCVSATLDNADLFNGDTVKPIGGADVPVDLTGAGVCYVEDGV